MHCNMVISLEGNTTHQRSLHVQHVTTLYYMSQR